MFRRHPAVRLFLLAGILAAGAGLAGCGQTGPLYLPPPGAKPAQPVSATAPQTVPASAPATR